MRARRKVTRERTKNHYILICARARVREKLIFCRFAFLPHRLFCVAASRFMAFVLPVVLRFAPQTLNFDSPSHAAACAPRSHKQMIYNTNFESGLPFLLAQLAGVDVFYYNCPLRCSCTQGRSRPLAASNLSAEAPAH